MKFLKGYGEVTAEDVEYSLEHIAIEVGGRRSPNQAYTDMIKAVDVVNPYAVRVRLMCPNAAFLTNMSFCANIVSNKAYGQMGKDVVRNPIGSGQFVLGRWLPDQEAVLTANPDYYAGLPKVKAVRFKIIEDETVAGMPMQAGELDTIQIRTGEVYTRLRRSPR